MRSSPEKDELSPVDSNHRDKADTKMRIFGKNSPSLHRRDGLLSVEGEACMTDEDEKSALLRDAIIKSFMVIFTNEKS